nr:hypothetical protein [uncultured Halomonas sp.]
MNTAPPYTQAPKQPFTESTWIGRIPDRLHARVYLLLLTMVLVVMAFVR